MNKIALYAIAWIGVPVAFAGFVYLSYSFSLAAGGLPFLNSSEMKWWVAFGAALLSGGTCVGAVRRVSDGRGIIWPFMYIALYGVVMSIVLGLVHLGVACHQGDCL